MNFQTTRRDWYAGSVFVALLWLAQGASASAEEQAAAPVTAKHQVTGLFSRDREADLKEAFDKIPTIKLMGIDYDNAEVTVEYEMSKAFPGAKPEEVVEHFDNLLKGASTHTFGVKPLRTTPMDQLTLVEIPIFGLDCKACCLAAYEIVYKLEGVERATASFRDGKMTALIDPKKTDRAKLEAALTAREVQITPPE